MRTTQSQHVCQPRPATHGRCIALFPGAFRPPHAAHLYAVRDLAARSNVDEVVVIVSNRCRCIPGTSKALDATVALRIWSIYLQAVARQPGIAKVRVELAAHTAVRHALGYFDRVKAGDSLQFCIGENDLKQGDGRFDKLTDLSRRSGVAAALIAAPTGSIVIRSTPLRATLAGDDAGRVAFMAALLTPLSAQQRAQVWQVCRQGMREMHDIIKNKVSAILERHGVGNIAVLSTVGCNTAKRDPVFRARCKDGSVLFVKYAGDTVESGAVRQNTSPKPRRRLATERRTLKRLRNIIPSDVELPEVVLFDKATRTLVLTEVCGGGRSLEDDLKKGIFDTAVAGAAGRFLARCHTIAGPVEPLWGDGETDLQHWRKMLALRTVQIESVLITTQIQRDLAALARASEKASVALGEGRGVLILDYCPRNILLSDGKTAIVDFEHGTSVGDPAYDLGFFLAHYVLWGLSAAAGNSCEASMQRALRQALSAYRQSVGDLWPSICSRVVAFVGATILYKVWGADQNNFQGCEGKIIRTATNLLASGLDKHADTDQLLRDAVAGSESELRDLVLVE